LDVLLPVFGAVNRPRQKRSKPEPIKEEDLERFVLVRQFEKLLAKAVQDREPSRSEKDPRRLLHADHYFSLLLFGLFNPVVDTLRGLSAITQLKRVQEICERKVSLGSLSEAQSVFDPDLLAKVVEELSHNHPVLLGDKRLEKLGDRVKLFDGSLLQALPRMTWALWLDDEHTAAKLHLKYSLMKGAPVGMLITEGNGSERAAALKLLNPGDLGIFDRGYGSEYAFFEQVMEHGCSFVGRVRNQPSFEVEEERPLCEEDRQVGVVSDCIVLLGERKIQLRLVTVEVDGKRLVLATDRFDLTADLVALLYRYRWQIELFFKWIKCILGCRHLPAESQQGVTIHVYLTLIAALLLTRFLGKKPNKRQMELLRFFMLGFCSMEELCQVLKIEKIEI
jgi:hypothetical protein